jgi:hypothetical protein
VLLTESSLPYAAVALAVAYCPRNPRTGRAEATAAIGGLTSDSIGSVSSVGNAEGSGTSRGNGGFVSAGSGIGSGETSGSAGRRWCATVLSCVGDVVLAPPFAADVAAGAVVTDSGLGCALVGPAAGDAVVDAAAVAGGELAETLAGSLRESGATVPAPA